MTADVGGRDPDDEAGGRVRHGREVGAGTDVALCELVEGRRASVAGVAFLVELSFLGGREKLAGYDVKTLIQYDAE